jgi:hypothetical protein
LVVCIAVFLGVCRWVHRCFKSFDWYRPIREQDWRHLSQGVRRICIYVLCILSDFPFFQSLFSVFELYYYKRNLLRLVNYYCLLKIKKVFRHLKKLEVVNLCRNQLYELPEEIGTLPLLKELNLDMNRIETIPEVGLV